MGRRENEIDPRGRCAKFAGDLRALRKAAGTPSYRDMSQRVHMSAATLAKAAGGASLPTWEATKSYVVACGGNVDEWERRWRQEAQGQNADLGNDFVDGRLIAHMATPAFAVLRIWSWLPRLGRLRKADIGRWGQAALDGQAIPDPRHARTSEQFVAAMVDLRTWAGQPSLRALSIAARRKGHNLAVTTLHDALSGARLPSLAVVIAFLAACRVTDTEPWLSAWRGIRAQPLPPVPKSRLAVLGSSHVLRLMLAATVLLVLVPVGYVAVNSSYWSYGCQGLFPTMSRTDTGECVGVVRNVDLLDTNLRQVAGRIAAENRQVAESLQRYAKIVLLTPLSESATSASAMSLDEIKRSIEGAYVAQYLANHDPELSDPSAVRIQMVLANQGSRGDYNAQLVQDILGQSEPDHPVVAVVGFGPSTQGGKATAQELARHGIPMVTAVATADDFDADDVVGLHSVSPSNTAYARSLGQLLDKLDPVWPMAGLIVADQSTDDLYTRSLRRAFEEQLDKYNKHPGQSFSSNTTDVNAGFSSFDSVVQNICSATREPEPLNVVFYAGRTVDFSRFAESLEARTCKSKPLVVFAGTTGFRAAREYSEVLGRANVTVIYPALNGFFGVCPDSKSADVVNQLKSALDEFGFDDPHPYTIMYHDAVTSAFRAIRLATRGGERPTSTGVRTQLNNLNFENAVPAATGQLVFFSTARNGRASGARIQYQQIGQDPPFDMSGLGCFVVREGVP